MNLEEFHLIEKEFQAYLEEVHPLILDVELHYGKFPTAVLNELRAFHTHISRSFRNGLGKEEVQKEVIGASRHMLRIKLDLYKYLILALHDKYYKDFLEEIKNVKLEMIDDGKFNVSYNQEVAKAMNQTKRAKQVEVRDPDGSLPIFMEALDLWRGLEQLVESNMERIVYAKRVYRTDYFFSKPVNFIVSSVGSAIIGIVVAYLFQAQIEQVVDLVKSFF